MSFRLALIFIILSTLIACNSIGTRLYATPLCQEGHKYCTGEPYIPYTAIEYDVNVISLCNIKHCYLATIDFFVYVPMSIVDIPFSLVFDTVLLPVDSYYILNNN